MYLILVSKNAPAPYIEVGKKYLECMYETKATVIKERRHKSKKKVKFADQISSTEESDNPNKV